MVVFRWRIVKRSFQVTNIVASRSSLLLDLEEQFAVIPCRESAGSDGILFGVDLIAEKQVRVRRIRL
jgi:hypothetical protein